MPLIEELLPRAVAAQRQGDFAAAENDYRQILAMDPRHAISLSNLGVILGRRGELDEAIRAAEAAIQADPKLGVAYFNLGNLYRRVNRSAEAISCYRQVLRLSPGLVQAQVNLGIALGEIGDWEASVAQLQQLAEAHPAHQDVMFHLGEGLTRLDRISEAVPVLRAAVKQSPQQPRVYLALARALILAGQVDEAIYTIQHALRIQPEHAFAHHLLGIALDRVERFDEAQFHFREAVRVRPDFAAAWSNLANSLSGQGRTAEAADALTRSLEVHPDPGIASQRMVLLLSSSSMTPGQLRDEHLQWASTYAAPAATHETVVPARLPGSKISIGYVLGPFPNAATLDFIEAILRRHDRGQFHITCYVNFQPTQEVLDRLRHADRWGSLAGLSDERAAEQIRADHIDLLIDLNGHTSGNRLLTFARRPARLQLSVFGYPSTTGLSAIDYRITDSEADPPGVTELLGPEKLLRLPGSGRLYVPPASAPEPNPSPAAAQSFMTFGCLNSPGKLSDGCLITWAEMLRRVPNSRLVMQTARSAESARYLTDRFTSQGIERSRLVLIYRLPEAEYLLAYQSIDIALDPFPFNGRTTICDALWMGVPVLSIEGPDCRSRQAVSILKNLGLGDFVASSPDKFVQLATTWAEAPDAIAELRSGLREIVRHSSLTDADVYVRNLEEAYREAMKSSGKF